MSIQIPIPQLQDPALYPFFTELLRRAIDGTVTPCFVTYTNKPQVVLGAPGIPRAKMNTPVSVVGEAAFDSRVTFWGQALAQSGFGVVGDCNITGLTTTGVLWVDGPIRAGGLNITNGTITIGGAKIIVLDPNADSMFWKGLTVMGNISTGRNVAISGDATIAGLTKTGNLIVGGPITSGDSVTAKRLTVTEGTLDIGNKKLIVLNPNGTSTLWKDATIWGNLSLQRNLSVSGDAGVGGNLAAGSAMIAGAATLGGRLTALGGVMGTWNLKATANPSASASFDFTGLQSNRHYRILFQFVQNTADARLTMRFNGLSDGAYRYAGRSEATDTGTAVSAASNGTSIPLMSTVDSHDVGDVARIDVEFSARTATDGLVQGFNRGWGINSGATVWFNYFNGFERNLGTGAALSYVTLLPSAGTVTGTAYLLELLTP